MSKRNSANIPFSSAPGLPDRLNSIPDASVSQADDGDEDHLYSNFDAVVDYGRQRAMTESSKSRVGKKPMPAPKPGFTKTDPHQKKVVVSRRKSSGVDMIKREGLASAEKQIPEESLYEEAIIVRKDKFKKDTIIAPEESLYAEPIEVAGHLLPSYERNVQEADLSPEPIYDEASAVCASRLPSMEKSKWPASKSPESPEEHLYEDAATVLVKKLPSGEVNGTFRNKFKAPVEPIYCEAEPVVSRKQPVEQKNSNSKPVENHYAEAAEVKKSDESSDEEEPMYFNLLLLQKSIANQSLWNSRADPFHDKAKLEQNARRFSAIKVLPALPPKKLGQHLGLILQESLNKPGKSFGSYASWMASNNFL